MRGRASFGGAIVTPLISWLSILGVVGALLLFACLCGAIAALVDSWLRYGRCRVYRLTRAEPDARLLPFRRPS